MGESYAKAQVADVVVSLSRKPEEKASGGGRLFVAKNRAGRDGMLFPININTAMSIITILDIDNPEMTLNDVVEMQKASGKNMLQNKWKEVMNSKG